MGGSGLTMICVALTVGACTTGSVDVDTAPPRPEPPGDVLIWGPCEDDAVAFSDKECATLTVPIDHDDPGIGTTTLSLLRRPSPFSERRIGTLVWLEGGPGGLGTNRVAHTGFSIKIENAFDIVAWDPRGVGGPSRLTCGDDWNVGNDPFIEFDLNPSPAEAAEQTEVIDELAARCLLEHGELLTRVGTYESVRDLDLIRQALGEDQLTLIGASYGSKVGVVYATTYPERVRALVLDGYDDPNEPPMDVSERVTIAFDQRLDEVLEICGAQRDCLLGTEEEPRVAFDRLAARLEEQPLAVEGGDLVTKGMLFWVVRNSLYNEYAVPGLVRALGEAAAGDGTGIHRLYAAQVEWERSIGTTPVTNQAIICADRAGAYDDVTEAEIARYDARVARLAPRMGTPWRSPAHGICRIQPLEESRLTGPFDAAGAGPILVLGVTGDQATPYAAAVRAIDDLEDAHLLTVEAGHHTTFLTATSNAGQPIYRCVLDVVQAFLIDLEIPPDDAVCRSE